MIAVTIVKLNKEKKYSFTQSDAGAAVKTFNDLENKYGRSFWDNF